MSLNLQIYDSPDKIVLLADFSNRAQGLKFGTNKHGYAAADWFVPMQLKDAFSVYDWPEVPHVVISGQGADIVYEGRLEDISIQSEGVKFGAFGYWRALSDVPYTALWGITSVNEWKPVSDDDISVSAPERYEFDANSRVYATMKKNEVYQNNNQLGIVGYVAPHNGQRGVVTASFDYEINLPSGFDGRLVSYYDDWSGFSQDWVQSSTGSLLSGSASVSISTKDRVTFQIINKTGSNYTNTSNTGVYYIKITNIRIKTTTAGTVLASDIATALATYINGINGDQLSAGSTKIEATSTDLKDELYEDEYPADILDRLAFLHNYQAAVWDDRLLTFAPKSSIGRTFYVDVVEISDLQRSLDPMRNSIYATYKGANQRTLRTATADDADSQAKLGIVRRSIVNVNTTDATEAETHRDARLTDMANYAIRARIVFDAIYTETGAWMPLYELKTGDTLIMRNLPPVLSTNIDNIRSFRVGTTDYDGDNDQMNVEPEVPVPTLVTLIAQKVGG